MAPSSAGTDRCWTSSTATPPPAEPRSAAEQFCSAPAPPGLVNFLYMGCFAESLNRTLFLTHFDSHSGHGVHRSNPLKAVVPAKAGTHRHRPLEYGPRLSPGRQSGTASTADRNSAGHGVHRSISRSPCRGGSNDPPVRPPHYCGKSSAPVPADPPPGGSEIRPYKTRSPLDMGSIDQNRDLALPAPRSGATTLLRVLCASVVNLFSRPRWTWGPSVIFTRPRSAPA